MRDQAQETLHEAFRRSRLHDRVDHLRKLLRDPEYRTRDHAARRDFVQFCRERGGSALRQNLLSRNGSSRKALILSQAYLPFAKLEAVVMKAMHMAGFDTIVCGNRRYDFLRYG